MTCTKGDFRETDGDQVDIDYVVSNNTDSDFRLANLTNAYVWLKTRKPGALERVSQEFIDFKTPIFVPARQRVVVTMLFRFPACFKKEEAQPSAENLFKCINEKAPNFASAVLGDLKTHYQLQFPFH